MVVDISVIWGPKRSWLQNHFTESGHKANLMYPLSCELLDNIALALVGNTSLLQHSFVLCHLLGDSVAMEVKLTLVL